MAYSLAPSSAIKPYVTDHRYSSLHQERSYLLSALATEGARAERMTRALDNARAKVQSTQADGSSVEATSTLRKTVAAITRKLKKCHKSQRAMASNLAAVTARIQMLEQHQWRKAQFEYSQRMQQTPMYGMALGLQEMALNSPVFPAYGHPCTPYPAAPYNLSPLGWTLPSMPATPILHPQSAISTESSWNMTLPTLVSYCEQVPVQYVANTPFNTPQPFMATTLQMANIQQIPYTISNELTKKCRRLSLPDPLRKGSLRGIGEEAGLDETTDLGRRLSMDGGASASLRI